MSSESIRQPALCKLYEKYLDSSNLLAFVGAVAQHYSPGTLERLANHADCAVRRAAVYALGLIGDFSVNPTVGRALRDEDRTVRLLAERGIRFVWNRVGSPPQRERLADIVRLNARGRHREAVDRCSQLLRELPEFAEVWYQRGTACYELQQLPEALDCWHQALELNPYHFVAAGGMGHAFLKLGNPTSALEAFRRALRLFPEQVAVRRHVEQLASELE